MKRFKSKLSLSNPLTTLALGVALLVAVGGLYMLRGSGDASAQRFFQIRTLPVEDIVVDETSGSNDSEQLEPDDEGESMTVPDNSTDDTDGEEETEEESSFAQANISYWIYPGNPACNTRAELESIEQVFQLKPEFATINSAGDTIILTEADAGCNALSRNNIDYYNSKSTEQFVTISGSGEGFKNLVNSPTKRAQSVQLLTDLMAQVEMTGIELDFEGYSGWTAADYQGYKVYLQELGASLQSGGYKLMIDAPAIYNDGIQSVFEFRYSDFENLPVDYITVMAYDYQYDYGGASPVTEDQFLLDSIARIKEELPSWQEKLWVGLPTYGYTAQEGAYRITILTRDQVFDRLSQAQIDQATRIPNSMELIYKDGSQVYVWQDDISVQHKIDLVQGEGIDNIAIWHLGGNPLVD